MTPLYLPPWPSRSLSHAPCPRSTAILPSGAVSAGRACGMRTVVVVVGQVRGAAWRPPWKAGGPACQPTLRQPAGWPLLPTLRAFCAAWGYAPCGTLAGRLPASTPSFPAFAVSHFARSVKTGLRPVRASCSPPLVRRFATHCRGGARRLSPTRVRGFAPRAPYAALARLRSMSLASSIAVVIDDTPSSALPVARLPRVRAGLAALDASTRGSSR